MNWWHQIAAGGGARHRHQADKRTEAELRRRIGENHASVSSSRHPRGHVRRADPRRQSGIPPGRSDASWASMCAGGCCRHPGATAHMGRRSRHYHRQHHGRAKPASTGARHLLDDQGCHRVVVRWCAAWRSISRRAALPSNNVQPGPHGYRHDIRLGEKGNPLIPPVGRMGSTADSPPWWRIWSEPESAFSPVPADHRRRFRLA